MTWVELYYSEGVRYFESGTLSCYCLIYELQLLRPKTCASWHAWALTHPHTTRLWLLNFALLTNWRVLSLCSNTPSWNMDSSGKRTLFLFTSVHLQWAQAQLINGCCLWPLFSKAFILHVVVSFIGSCWSLIQCHPREVMSSVLVFVLLHVEIQSDSLKLLALNSSKSLKLMNKSVG